jgi:abnormal spindle-like microcephaly-associated protein
MAMQTIKQAGVPLSDPDGVTISAEDIAAGDKELILSLLWNTFIHLQVIWST